MRASINYRKLALKFNPAKVTSGGYLYILRYNTFLARSTGFGFKISKLDFKKLMVARGGLHVLKAFRRVDRTLYRRQTLATAVHFNVVACAADDGASRVFLSVPPVVRYRRTNNFQVLAFRGVVLRKVSTIFCTLRGCTGFYINSIFLFNTATIVRWGSFTC